MMNNLKEEILIKLEKSFLLTNELKEELKHNIIKSDNREKLNELLDNLRYENDYINDFLQGILNNENKDLSFIEISYSMRLWYIKKVKLEEERENEKLDSLENELYNVF